MLKLFLALVIPAVAVAQNASPLELFGNEHTGQRNGAPSAAFDEYSNSYSSEMQFYLFGLPEDEASGTRDLARFCRKAVNKFNKQMTESATDEKIFMDECDIFLQKFSRPTSRRVLEKDGTSRELQSVNWSLFLSTMTFSCGRFCWDDPVRRSLRSLTEMFGGETNHRQLVKNFAQRLKNTMSGNLDKYGNEDIYYNLRCVIIKMGDVLESSRGCTNADKASVEAQSN